MADPEAMLLALVKRMVERGTLDIDDVNAIADELEPQDPDSAHQVRLAGLLATTGGPTSEREHQAHVRRRSIRLIAPDGGKRET